MIQRVFLSRHYIDVSWFDIDTGNTPLTKRQLKNLAVKLAYVNRPNSRGIAVDNGWLPEEPVDIKKVGYSASGTQKLNKVFDNGDIRAYTDTTRITPTKELL